MWRKKTLKLLWRHQQEVYSVVESTRNWLRVDLNLIVYSELLCRSMLPP